MRRLLPLALLAGGAGVACRQDDVARPDIVLVVADTLRAGYLGCYGFDGETSPHLDRLATESVRFEACFSQAPWTKPSIASLFTSLHPQTHGVVTHGGAFGGAPSAPGEALATDALPDEAETLAEVLSRAGYATAAFVDNPWIRRELGFAQGFDDFEARDPKSTGELFERAGAWALDRARGGAPFFLYLHVMEVHGPYGAPQADFDAVRDAAGLGPDRELTARDRRRRPKYLGTPDWTRAPEAERLRTWRARYAAGVRAFDARLAAFVERLAQAGVLDDTVLVVTSDHGEELLEHGRWDHGDSLHDHQLHVPLLIRYPNGEGAGAVVSEPVELLDLAPTVLSLAGVPSGATFQGRDLGGLQAVAEPARQESCSVSTGVKWKPGMVSLRTRTHRLIVDPTGIEGDREVLLFDLERDPSERSNLAEVEPELRDRLLTRLEERLRTIESVPALEGARVEVSEEMREKLGHLGYVEDE